MVLYHGSNVVVQKPKVLTNGHYKDFGYGFYCTNLEKQAVKWALVKFKYPTHQIVFCIQEALSTLQYERSYQL